MNLKEHLNVVYKYFEENRMNVKLESVEEVFQVE